MGEGFQVLVADDEKIIREGIAGFVPWEELGMSLSACVRNGQEALEYMKDHEIDVIISDIRMPAMGGLEMAQELERRQRPPYIILISGYSEFTYAQKAVKLKCVVDYVLKPVEVQRLKEVLIKTRESLLLRKHQIVVPSLSDSDEVLGLGNKLTRMNTELIQYISMGEKRAVSEQMERLADFWRSGELQRNRKIRQCCELLLSIDGLLSGYGSSLSKISQMEAPIDYVKLLDVEGTICWMGKLIEGSVDVVCRKGTGNFSALIKSAISEINRSYTSSDFSLQILSERLLVSSNHLSAKFKEETGVGFVKYLNEKRMERAKLLLKDVSKRIYEVALLCGIEDVRYFTRLFKEYTGITPKEYRDKMV